MTTQRRDNGGEAGADDRDRAPEVLDNVPRRVNRRTAFRVLGVAGVRVVAAVCSSGETPRYNSVIGKLPLPQTTYPTTVSLPEPHPTVYVPPVTDPNAPFDNAAQPPKVVSELNPAVPAAAGAMIWTLDDLRVWAANWDAAAC